MPNTLAYIALLVWPVVSIVIFRRLSIERALIWSMLAGYLLLPPIASFDLPLIPDLNKATIPTLMAGALCILLVGRKAVALPESKIIRLLLFISVVAPLGTALTNSEPLVFANNSISGLTIYDAGSSILRQIIIILPFLLARNLLSTPQAHREILFSFFIAGLAYSIPMLIEVRLSPQLNVWIYGFFQHAFDQMIRYGGFRPIVFLEHGLWVAFFAFMAVSATAALMRYEPEQDRGRYRLAFMYLGIVLVLCKTAGVLIYTAALVPLILFFSTKMQIRAAAAMAVIVIAYPLLRQQGLIPIDQIVEFATSIDQDRAHSLAFRIQNEEMLLERAYEKAMFGWGGWGRNFVHDYWTGRSLTIVDGRWIIVFGISGWAGFLGEFGLLTLPAFVLWRRSRKVQPAELAVWVGPLSLILAANLFDLLPNATVIPFTWLMAGAILGYSESLVRKTRQVQEQPAAQRARPAPQPATEPAKEEATVNATAKPDEISERTSRRIGPFYS